MAENAEWKWRYEKLDDEGNITTIGSNFTNDADGKITGRIVINVKAWFDENPAERVRLGWTKHLYLEDVKEVQKIVPYNPASQFIVTGSEQIDEYTIRDVYYVIDKSEEQLAFEEMLSVSGGVSFDFGAMGVG